MKNKGLLTRAGVGAVGALLLTGVAGAAIADEVGSNEVDVSVDIEALPPVGALTMSVAADSTTLTEVDSEDPEVRRFDGTLPTVTVSDDREDVPEGVFWYVVGQSSAFTAEGAPEIGPEHLGWVPELLTENDGEVAPGEEVDTVLDDGGEGLTGQELLALAMDSNEAHAIGEWEANADLFLKTPADVAPGSYSATITLSLWEDAY
ncbi:hypothetical protein [uncultured Georgenia sp.]|uniref:hypothetical protein n=1 Tax=uncultured Georgenia sp. TaxID=378209 RepID=UPI002609E232|nr:hypothetical protein [uncultured Georgenia sp.]HLV05027.1 hypothetical protein [Actinomycetaceae bacterium]